MKKINRAIRKMQKADPAVQQIWLWVLTIGASAVVVAGWMLYLNVTVAGVSYEGVVLSPAANYSVVDTFSAGARELRRQAKQGVATILQQRELAITAPTRTFVYAGLKKLPAVSLP